jgi:tetratricopeptide (TPR) repeat protein
MLKKPKNVFVIIILAAALTAGCATSPAPSKKTGQLPEGHIPIDGKSLSSRQGGAYATFMQGVMLAREGNRKDAIIFMEASSKMDPGSETVLSELMKLYMDEGRRDNARETAEKILAINEGNPDAHTTMGRIYMDMGQPALASRHLERSIEIKPDQVNLYFLLAEAYEQHNQPEKGIEVLSDLAVKEEHAAIAQYYIARMYARLGNTDLSLDALRKAIELNKTFISAVNELGSIYEKQGKVEDAIGLYRKYLEEDGDELAIREVLARLLLTEDLLEDSRKELQIIIEVEPERTSALLLMGLLESRDGNNSEALAMFKRVRSATPGNYEVIMQVGTLQRKLKSYQDAEESFQEAAKIAPERYEPYVNLAIVYDSTDRQNLAVNSLETAIALEPSRVSVINYLAQLLIRMNRDDQAIDILEQALQISPDKPALMYQLGITYDQNGDFDRTVKIMKRIIEVDPSHYDAMNYLGYSWADRDIYLPEALKLVMTALELKPDASYIMDSLGWIYFKFGQYEEALVQLHEAEKNMASDPTVLEHIGDTYERLGKDSDAIDYWSKALIADPDLDRVREKLRSKGAKIPIP